MSQEDKNLIDAGNDQAAKLNHEDYQTWKELKVQELMLVRAIILEVRPDLVEAEREATAAIKSSANTKEKFANYKIRRKVRNDLHRLTNRIRKELNDGLNSYIHWGA